MSNDATIISGEQQRGQPHRVLGFFKGFTFMQLKALF